MGRKNYPDLTGMKFGRLLVIKRVESVNRHIMYRCICDCGNEITTRGTSLIHKNTISCGCYNLERTSNMHKTHGLSRTKLHKVWISILQRCENPNSTAYKYYGGRGITVSSEWHDYKMFYEWAMQNKYKNGLTVDRIDNNKGYSKENCRLVTQKDQCNNTRTNRLITINGETKTAHQWADIYKVGYTCFLGRINRGIDPLAALNPNRKFKKGEKY